MEQPPPDIQDTLERMELSQKEKATSTAAERRPAGSLWIRNARDLLLIVGIMLVFAVTSVVIRHYLSKSLWAVFNVLGTAVVYIVIMSMVRKKEPNQPPDTTRGK